MVDYHEKNPAPRSTEHIRTISLSYTSTLMLSWHGRNFHLDLFSWADNNMVATGHVWCLCSLMLNFKWRRQWTAKSIGYRQTDHRSSVMQMYFFSCKKPINSVIWKYRIWRLVYWQYWSNAASASDALQSVACRNISLRSHYLTNETYKRKCVRCFVHIQRTTHH